MDKPVLIFGAGPLALAAIEIFEGNKNVVYGILDDRKEMEGKEYGDVAVLSNTSDEDYLKLVGKTCEAFIATDDAALRKEWVKMFTKSKNSMPVNAVHKESSISSHAFIGHGNFIAGNVRISSGSEIGNHCVLHPGVAVGYNVKGGDFLQIGQGVEIGQEVIIEDNVFIGTGAVIVPGISIGKGARIGAGSVVIENVKASTTVFGNPAKKVQV